MHPGGTYMNTTTTITISGGYKLTRGRSDTVVTAIEGNSLGLSAIAALHVDVRKYYFPAPTYAVVTHSSTAEQAESFLLGLLAEQEGKILAFNAMLTQHELDAKAPLPHPAACHCSTCYW
jgi:hypothetical protein